MNKAFFEQVKQLGFHGLIAHWDELNETIDLETLIRWEVIERHARGLRHRIKAAKLEEFKPLADFDWNWPKKCDREQVEELMTLDFIQENANIILSGPNGAGKSTIAANITYQAILKGYNALYVTASFMLNDLTSQDGDRALSRRLKYYAKPVILYLDEVGYLSYSAQHADLLFEIISRRYKKKPTIITTNKPFIEWDQIFPNASCVVSLIDRLVHKSEIVQIDADSYRLKEAKEKSAERKKTRTKKSTLLSQSNEAEKLETTLKGESDE